MVKKSHFKPRISRISRIESRTQKRSAENSKCPLRLIDADKSDLFDVLAHVTYALPTITRADRAATDRVHINSEFNDKQRAFLDFVLAHCVSEGVEELDQKELTPLLRLKYHDSLPDALADLGKPEEIGQVFAEFQKYLYQGGA